MRKQNKTSQVQDRSVLTKRIATMGMLVGIAFVLSYVEALFPFSIGLPGAKIGLANLAVLAALYLLGEKEAFGIALVRLILVAFTFGNLAAFLYSLGGMVCSYTGMVILKKCKLFSIIGVSCVGGVLHNIGQLLVAFFILKTAVIWTYLPLLIVSGVVAGVGIGLIGGALIQRLNMIMRLK